MWGAIVAARVLAQKEGGGGGRGRYNGLPWWPKGVNAGGHEKLKLFPKSHLSNISKFFFGGGGGGGTRTSCGKNHLLGSMQINPGYYQQ